MHKWDRPTPQEKIHAAIMSPLEHCRPAEQPPAARKRSPPRRGLTVRDKILQWAEQNEREKQRES